MPLQKQLISTIEMLSHWPRFRLRLFLEGLFVGIISGSVISLFRSLLEKGTIYREYIYQHVLWEI